MRRHVVFADRHDAGQQLASIVARRELRDPVVLGLARGGVPVAYEVARVLDAPLDVYVSRKVGVPGRREFGVGAVAEDGQPRFGPHVAGFDFSDAEMEDMVAREVAEVRRQVRLYRGDRPPPAVEARSVVLVDDGLATGVTAIAAVQALLDAGAEDLVVAVPAAAADTAEGLRETVEVLTVIEPDDFRAVSVWYREFEPTRDDDVLRLLGAANFRR